MQELTPAMKSSGAVPICVRLGEISGGNILDVCTQDGSFIGTMMKAFRNYDSFVGIDISEENLEKARKKFSDEPVEFILMNTESLIFDDDSFDTVCISHSIHHLENPIHVLKEMLRVLKPGGHLILQELFCDDNQSEAKQTDILIHHWGAKIDTMRGEPHFETLPRKQIRNFVTALGLNDIEEFESKRYVKCLFCENQEKCEDPMNSIDFAIEEVDRVLQRIVDHPEYNKFGQEAHLLRERIRTTGFESASLLFFICKKNLQ
ncbi:MAG: class I SAM-dependent methyltransferase [Candidatus Thorarchaeota archaeon]|nr:class I SAM-dependent methyltransferase [Candidatus Thorarchaeota archaeon]